MYFSVQLEGAEEIRRKLKHLEAKVQRRIVRPAVTRALSPVLKQAKQNVPVVTGLLKRSLGKKVKAYSRTGVIWGGIGPRSGFKEVGADGRARNPVNYMHLVELGTEHTAAKAPLRRALQSRKGDSMRILSTDIPRNIEKEVARA